ncbi:hypothetical protein O181_014277 [Austropuccinia psidii MF-1]|uniref:Chromo domain-containing protein n=1 Tax=Austropuccinia psidii MF-1 TaxID=1389203 RepID=A0A9Q3BZW2_9BASI|nr:hypothetical protein [Austropuccinia psidii MF-1]
MWKGACDTAARWIAEEKEYKKQRWHKSHMEHDFKEWDHVLVATLNFNNMKGPKNRRHSFLGPFTIIQLIGKKQWRKTNPTPQEIVEVEGSPGPVKKIIKARKIRLNGKDQRQYLVRFKNQMADKDTWLAEDSIPDGNPHLKIFGPLGGLKSLTNDEPFLEGGYVSL